jgi:hypothetical protein
MVKSRENLIGAYSFLIGVVLAVAIGIFNKYFAGTTSNVAYVILVVLGIIIGFVNVADKDSITFLLASLALVIVGGLGNNTLIFISNINPILGALSDVMSSLLVLFIPATIIVALKTVFSIAKI